MPIDPGSVPRCLPGSSLQHAMTMIGASVIAMAAGRHQIARSCVQRARAHGVSHAGIAAFPADTAGGFAAPFTPGGAARWLYRMFVEDVGRPTHVAPPVASTAVNTATER